MSDVQATTQDLGAAGGQEAAFQNFWDASEAAERPREEEAAQTQQNDAQEVRDAQSEEQGAQKPEGDQAAAQEAETPAYSSLNEMLAAHKIDPESVMGLHVTAKIDGKEMQVPLADVLKSYQLEGHVNNKSIELSNQKAQFEQEQHAVRAMFQQQIQQNQQLGNLAMQMLNHDYQKIDWNSLRANNPAEFAALQQEFQQRQAGIQNYLGQIQQQTALEAQQQQQNLAQQLAAENERLMGARPAWRDPAAFSKDREQMSQYARSVGFKDAELSQIYDHRYMLILHDAAQFRALQAATPQALKQVRQAPVMAKPGSRVDSNPNVAKRQQVMDRLGRNPRDQDAQADAFEFFANQ
ncbi:MULTISPECIES: hypothetical protein [Paraburkholderia]|uniref:hypothetical protein n=1 Tax=Paraburkholderia TaxID=1822464 RepID=UPI0038BCC0B4